MVQILLDFLLLVTLFIVLGFSADLLVKNIKVIASKLGMSLFALGILLGIITSFPEISVGINAALKGVSNISLGNLLGGIMVIFGLILGVSLVLNRKVKTDGKVGSLVPEALLILFPLVLGVDGYYNFSDGVLLIGSYLLLLIYLYRKQGHSNFVKFDIAEKKKIVSAVFWTLISIIAIILTSRFILDVTVDLLHYLAVSQFIIGLLVFAVGTNLPEITIALASWRRRSFDLSLSHLSGSAITNVPIIGMLAMIKPFNVAVGLGYYSLFFFVALALSMFIYFYHSNKSLSRAEGAVLVVIYFVFLTANIYLK